MRTFLPILAFASTFLTVLSAPTPEAAALPDKAKKDVSSVSILTDLTGSIQSQLAAIRAFFPSYFPTLSPLPSPPYLILLKPHRINSSIPNPRIQPSRQRRCDQRSHSLSRANCLRRQRRYGASGGVESLYAEEAKCAGKRCGGETGADARGDWTVGYYAAGASKHSAEWDYCWAGVE